MSRAERVMAEELERYLLFKRVSMVGQEIPRLHEHATLWPRIPPAATDTP